MLRLRDNNWLVRIAYFPDNYIPRHVSLCALFWRIVFRLVIASILLAIVGAYIVTWIKEPSKAFIITMTLVAIPMFTVVMFYADKAIKKGPTGVVSTAIWGIKNKICPLIRIVREWDADSEDTDVS